MYGSGRCIIPIEVAEIGGNVAISVQPDKPISVYANRLDSSVNVSCSVICTESKYQLLLVTEGEFILADGKKLNVTRL